MRKSKRDLLEARGWKVGSAEEFLELSPEESTFVNMKLALARSLRERRQNRELTQMQLAKLLGSSQSRVAKMEAADASVSMDLMVRALLALGASAEDVAKILGRAGEEQAA
ncbi:MAG: helix-turn-helix transcriptional regulator [Acidobacteriota bacterium]